MNFLHLKIPPVIILLFFITLTAVAKLHFATMEHLGIAPLFFAVCALVAGVTYIMLGVWQFRKARTTVNPLAPEDTSQLVESGIYAKTRNPMYVGFALLLVSWGCFLSTFAMIPCVILFMVYMQYFQIIPEEKILTAKFGDAYLEYMKKAKRWV